MDDFFFQYRWDRDHASMDDLLCLPTLWHDWMVSFLLLSPFIWWTFSLRLLPLGLSSRRCSVPRRFSRTESCIAFDNILLLPPSAKVVEWQDFGTMVSRCLLYSMLRFADALSRRVLSINSPCVELNLILRWTIHVSEPKALSLCDISSWWSLPTSFS